MLDKNKKKLNDKKRRNKWVVNPVTRIKVSKKLYSRKNLKKLNGE